MKSKWLWLGIGVLVGAVVAPKIHSLIPPLPTIGRG